MGIRSKTFNGARAILKIDGKTIGIAQSVSGQINFGVDPIMVMGRYEAAELVPQSQAPVTMNMRMVRIFGVSPSTKLRLPTLNDVQGNGLLNNQDFTVEIDDRDAANNPSNPLLAASGDPAVNPQGDAASKSIFQVVNCRTTGFTFDTSSGQTSEITLSVVGITYADEGTPADQNADADAPAYGVA